MLYVEEPYIFILLIKVLKLAEIQLPSLCTIYYLSGLWDAPWMDFFNKA